MVEAKIVEIDGFFEVRCSGCGKLLCKIEKKSYKNVDKTARAVIIISRCARKGCKLDNFFSC